MKQYLGLMKKILEHGNVRKDRTGTGTVGLFGEQLKFDLSDGFPLLTTKRLYTRAIFIELVWFLQGRTDVQWLNERGVGIWDEWSTEEQCARFGREPGDLGPIYGHQWTNFGAQTADLMAAQRQLSTGYRPNGVNQLARLVEGLIKNPWSRRHIVTAWNPMESNSVALPPCHTMFQCRVSEDKHGERTLDLQLYQRSADYFLGVPFNIASYAMLLTLLAKICGYKPGVFTHTFGDVHLYLNHIDQAQLQLTRDTLQLPTVSISDEAKCLRSFRYPHISIHGYNPHPHIVAEVSV